MLVFSVELVDGGFECIFEMIMLGDTQARTHDVLDFFYEVIVVGISMLFVLDSHMFTVVNG